MIIHLDEFWFAVCVSVVHQIALKVIPSISFTTVVFIVAVWTPPSTWVKIIFFEWYIYPYLYSYSSWCGRPLGHWSASLNFKTTTAPLVILLTYLHLLTGGFSPGMGEKSCLENLSLFEHSWVLNHNNCVLWKWKITPGQLWSRSQPQSKLLWCCAEHTRLFLSKVAV